MGLSNTEAKEKLTTIQALLDIASAIKELPNLEQLSKDAYALPERDIAKAEEGRTKIKEYEAVIAEQKKREADLIAEQDDIDKRSGEVAAALKVIEGKNADLDKRQKVLDETADIQDKVAKELSQREQNLSAGTTKLAADILALKEEKQRVADYDADLKAKADKLKALIG